ncbi:MAG TPA: CBS domain-containing protein [Anaerolineae bacterium]|nr:CBS domain-containing protein [Anaerolineae bacterium]HQK15394.1 CBS domain-containing protein [Anaerolineae bacterium]
MKSRFALLTFLGKEGALSKVHELVREMRVSRVMTTSLFTISPDASMAELKELMREHHISGVPVLENGNLVGIVSIEDLIHALEQGKLGNPVREFMTSGRLIVAQANEPVMEAVRRFEATKIGRMPVLDTQEKLVGILTRGDIMEALLDALQEVYSEVERTHERPEHFFEALESDSTSLVLRYHVKARDFARGGDASAKIKQALLRIGAPAALARRVAIATYEAEINLIIHTDNGGTITADIKPAEISVLAEDQGPGIPDVELACQPGYSTATPEIREMGFGAGMGLVNIKRCTDTMHIWSAVGIGTRLQMVFRVPPAENP